MRRSRRLSTLATLIPAILLGTPALPALAGDRTAPTFLAKLRAADPDPSDLFGASVAIRGGTAVAGAFGDDDVHPESGAAYVFERDIDDRRRWRQTAKLKADDAATLDQFGYSVGISGDAIVVGAFLDDDAGTDSGSAYVFERGPGGHWQQAAKLVADDAEATDFFGFAVAISGDVAIVGAWQEDGVAPDSGAAYVFERDTRGSWQQVAKLLASDAEQDDYFGYSVAVDGETAIVGAYLEDEGAVDAGAAYVFERDAGGVGAWGQTAKLVADDAGATDEMGLAVAISGDVALVGAYSDDDAGGSAGSAYLFERNAGGGEAWGQTAKLLASDAETGDQFGTSVAISGNVALVGSPSEDDGAVAAGAAYVFERTGDGWVETARIKPPHPDPLDLFGYAVALGHGTSFVGAWFDDDGGVSAGAGYVIGLNRLGPASLAEDDAP